MARRRCQRDSAGVYQARRGHRCACPSVEQWITPADRRRLRLACLDQRPGQVLRTDVAFRRYRSGNARPHRCIAVSVLLVRLSRTAQRGHRPLARREQARALASGRPVADEPRAAWWWPVPPCRAALGLVANDSAPVPVGASHGPSFARAQPNGWLGVCSAHEPGASRRDCRDPPRWADWGSHEAMGDGTGVRAGGGRHRRAVTVVDVVRGTMDGLVPHAVLWTR